MKEKVEVKKFLDREISWEEFFEVDNSPKIYVGFASTISPLKAIELAIKNPMGSVEETLFVFNPLSRESVLRNIDRLNEGTSSLVVTEISGVLLIEFLSRWSSQQSIRQ